MAQTERCGRELQNLENKQNTGQMKGNKIGE